MLEMEDLIIIQNQMKTSKIRDIFLALVGAMLFFIWFPILLFKKIIQIIKK